MKLINKVNGQIIAHEVIHANTFWKRLKGLMFTKHFSPGLAVHIQPCQSIHTFFMNYNIDVLYLDDDLSIVSLTENMKTWKFGKVVKSSTSVVELPEGTICKTNTKVGQFVEFKK